MEQNIETVISEYEDQAYPLATLPSLSKPAKPAECKTTIKKIILATVQGAYEKKRPTTFDINCGRRSFPFITEEQTQVVVHMIEALQPADAIEAALASQFVISYMQGLKEAPEHSQKMMELFRFGHEVLDTLTKFRAKGAQQISVNYNHNQAQINNISVVEKERPIETIEVCEDGRA